ncbi:MAG: Hsp20/alpha crystallin family protein [candidate division KSB1 bacterium]|nr:Hsp20/alpha crystallin family protein [candidate division KSB1 bacterium]MDZ7273205.1 Hsp20/alpha crystallin family protein [candidate division KSB1 bacterium]MDZ7285307.1 Hsp20/alpha crystallin family protein [candidate division KSB1 bacterium]MDZ7298339.1 Hsp20/alpha crystallin family protein [candidate division KSB1 bacterium]MDZ7349028.1 Hsp20/alpha crystallin family protein [candidate division KSB1 bacterium]
MAIMRWNPTRELARLEEDFDRFFRNFLSDEMLETSLTLGAWEPAVDIHETDDHYAITAELPGLSRENFKVSYNQDVLTITGERKQVEEKGRTYHRRERNFGKFERSFRLPANIVAEKIEASFKDGVLTLILPKAEEARPKHIAVKAS